jgi:hypothetical protein
MPNPIQLELTDEQRSELEQVRDHDPRPYMREHAEPQLNAPPHP